MLEQHRQEREDSENRERRNELRREQCIRAQRQYAMAFACRDAALIRCFLRHEHAADAVADKCICKGKRNDPERITLQKFCPRCRQHREHRETK